MGPALKLSKPESLLTWAQGWSISCGQGGLHPESKNLCRAGTLGCKPGPAVASLAHS